jgi:hypothetical protein
MKSISRVLCALALVAGAVAMVPAQATTTHATVVREFTGPVFPPFPRPIASPPPKPIPIPTSQPTSPA